MNDPNSPPDPHREPRAARIVWITLLAGGGLFLAGSAVLLVLVGRSDRRLSAEAIATTEVLSLYTALELYLQDEPEYPGTHLPTDPDTNLFPALYDALFGERWPNGPGGRSAPYTRIQESRIAVYDSDAECFRVATREERLDSRIAKYLLDPWGHPYVYRSNRGREPKTWMRNVDEADIYSLGPNGIDDTARGNDGDDIGDW